MRHHSVQGSVHADFPSHMHPLGATLEQLFVGVSAVHDDPERYGGIKPRASQSNQLSAQLGLAPVFFAQRLNLRPFRPPQTSGIGQTKYPVGYARQTNNNPDDDKATPYPIGFPVLGAFPSC